jgi:hypothetical protein
MKLEEVKDEDEDEEEIKLKLNTIWFINKKIQFKTRIGSTKRYSLKEEC